MPVVGFGVLFLVLAGSQCSVAGGFVSRPFLAQVEGGRGASLPRLVKDNFEAVFECSILAYGFVPFKLHTGEYFSEPVQALRGLAQ